MDASTLNALLGGLTIGLAAAILFGFAGRIAGISGILFDAIKQAGERSWRCLFILGLPLGGIAYHLLTGAEAPLLARHSYVLAVIGGLFVGVGVRRGAGCTSGHGVCGIARFSKRSFVATIVFMGSGIATASLVNMALGGFQ